MMTMRRMTKATELKRFKELEGPRSALRTIFYASYL